MLKHKKLEAKLHLRSKAESYSKTKQNFARNMTISSLSFHNDDYKAIFSIKSFLFHAQTFAYTYAYKHNDQSHCPNIVNP